MGFEEDLLDQQLLMHSLAFWKAKHPFFAAGKSISVDSFQSGPPDIFHILYTLWRMTFIWMITLPFDSLILPNTVTHFSNPPKEQTKNKRYCLNRNAKWQIQPSFVRASYIIIKNFSRSCCANLLTPHAYHFLETLIFIPEFELTPHNLVYWLHRQYFFLLQQNQKKFHLCYFIHTTKKNCSLWRHDCPSSM